MVCFAGGFPFDGSLAGVATPGSIVVDEVVDPVAASRIDATALVVDASCEPITLLNGGDDGFAGLAIRQSDGRWSRAAAPSSFRTGGVDFDAVDDHVQVFLSEGLATTSWTYDGAAWGDELSVIGYRAVSAAGVAPTGDSTARVAATDYMVSIGIYGLDAGAWTSLDDFQVGSGPFNVAIRGPSNALISSWRVPAGVDLERTGVRREGATDEEIAVVDGWFPDWDSLPATTQVPVNPALAVDAQGVPLVLTVRDAGPGLLETVLVRRDVAGWNTFAVASDAGSPCVVQDYDEGETCDYDYREVRPLSVVAGGPSEILGFLSVADREGTVMAAGGGGAYWTDVDDQTQYSLHVAWLEGTQVQTAELVAGTRVHRMSSFVDDAGRVHVVLNEGPTEASTVRYLRLEQ